MNAPITQLNANHVGKDTSFYASPTTNTGSMASIENDTISSQNPDAPTLSITANPYTTNKRVALITALDPHGEGACQEVKEYFTQLSGIEIYYETWQTTTKLELLHYLNNEFRNANVQQQDEK